jgi:hypothetical protein
MKVETDYSTGDVFCINDKWKAVCTAITIRASGQVEYQLEWLGDAEFKSDWLTRERIELLGVKRISEVTNEN